MICPNHILTRISTQSKGIPAKVDEKLLERNPNILLNFNQYFIHFIAA